MNMDEMNKEEFENTQESIDTSKEQYQGNMGGPVPVSYTHLHIILCLKIW